jgi:hypothetical protein
VQHAASQIHVLPVKAQRLPLPQPERDGDREQRREAVTGDLPEKGARLIRIQWTDFMLRDARHFHQRRHIPRDQPPPERLPEGRT